MRHKSLGLNAALNSIRSILNILFPIITFPYVSRVLQVKGIGIYNFSNSVISYFLLIAALGINTYAIREGAKIRDNKEKITHFASEVFTINIASTALAYLLLFFCLIVFTKLRNYVACISIFSLQIFFTTIGTEWIYQIYEDYGYITVRSIIFQIISIILLFVFVRNSNDYLKYTAITVFSTVGSNILNFICARQYCHIRLTWHFDWKKHLIPIMIFFGANVASMIYINSDVTILGFMKNDYVVGIYSVSTKVYQIIKTLITAILVVTIPRLAMLFGNHRMKDYYNILSNLTNSLVLLILPASTGLFMLAKEVVVIISGAKFLRATTSLQILCFAYVTSILAWVLNDCVLVPAKREKYILKNMSVSAVLNIVLNLALIPLWNESAAAFSTVISELYMLISNYYYSKDIAKKVFISKELLGTFIRSIIGCAGIVIVCLLSDWAWQSIILKTLFSVILSIIMYGAILVVLRDKTAIVMLKQIKMFLENKL